MTTDLPPDYWGGSWLRDDCITAPIARAWGYRFHTVDGAFTGVVTAQTLTEALAQIAASTGHTLDEGEHVEVVEQRKAALYGD